jgi:translation elongation factor EF-G
MDRMGANFLKVVGQIKTRLGANPVRCSWQLALKKRSLVLLTW